MEKIHSADTTNESALLARALCEAAPRTTRSEGDRAYIVAEGSNAVHFTPTVSDDVGRLEVTGTVRGGRLSADRLVHLPGRGDFQVESVSISETRESRLTVTRFAPLDLRLSLLTQSLISERP